MYEMYLKLNLSQSQPVDFSANNKAFDCLKNSSIPCIPKFKFKARLNMSNWAREQTEKEGLNVTHPGDTQFR